MAVIDERGRIFGRFNVIDALVVLAVLIMIPAAYAAYLLFRAPQPRLYKVEPTTIVQGSETRLLMWGEHMRPFMRVALNDIQARNFLISSTKGAEADLPDLPPGTYDVVLYDYAQEVTRLAKAITVVPANPTPNMEVQLIGAFVGLDEAGVAALKPGLVLPVGNSQSVTLVSTGTPQPATMRLRAGDTLLTGPVTGQRQVPATVRAPCFTEMTGDGTLRCVIPGVPNNVPAMPDAYLTFRTPERWYAFQIYEVHLGGEPPMATARARFLVSRTLAERVKENDVDTAISGYVDAHRPRILAIAGQRPAPSGVTADGVIGEPVFLDLQLRVPVQRGARGLLFKGRTFKAGATITFETREYVIAGELLEVTVEDR
jgi:hypothetical protein